MQEDKTGQLPQGEERIPLSETPHYKMIGYMLRLPDRFFRFQRDYYKGKEEDGELAEITTQFFGVGMNIGRNRLFRYGLTMDLELQNAAGDLEYGSESYNIRALENERDEYGIRRRLMTVRRRFYLDGKCIYQRKSREMSVVSVLKSKVKGDITVCPNCGYPGTISGFINGCEACGAQFTVNDFEPRVSACSLESPVRMQAEEMIEKVTVAFLMFVLLAAIFLIVDVAAMLIEIFTGLVWWSEGVDEYLVPVMNALLHSFHFAFPAIVVLGLALVAFNLRLNDDSIMGQENGEKLFRNFSVPDFWQNVEYKFRNIHLVDDAGSVQFLASCRMENIVPGYTDVVDGGLLKLHLTGGEKTEDGYRLTGLAVMRLFCYSRKHIHIEYETIKWSMYGKKEAVDKPIMAMRMCRCPNCGSILNPLEGVTCEYCGNIYSLSDYDWMIESYEGKRKRDALSGFIWWYTLAVFVIGFLLSL